MGWAMRYGALHGAEGRTEKGWSCNMDSSVIVEVEGEVQERLRLHMES